MCVDASFSVKTDIEGEFWAVMGNCCCACEHDSTVSEFARQHLSRAAKFPMQCISMDSFLRMDRIVSHGELEKRGLLMVPESHMLVHLISHEWLSSSVQPRRMQGVFRQIIDGRGRSLFMEDWISFSEGCSATWTKNTRNLEGSAQQDKFSYESWIGLPVSPAA